MALVLEDGSGVAEADTWITLDDATDYWDARLQPDWVACEDDRREAALRNAADYMLLIYKWPGQPATLTQRLPWPRAGVPSGAMFFPTTAIPTQIISAQLVLAAEDLTTPLLKKRASTPQLIEDEKGLKGLTKRQRFSPAEVEPVTQLARFPVVDQILAGIALTSVNPTIGVARLVRVL